MRIIAMKCLRWLGRALKIYSPVLYESISTLPIQYWFDIHETNDLTLLAKKGKRFYDLEKLKNTWEAINDEYLEEFGLPYEVELKLNQRIKAAKYKAKYIIENKRHYLTHAIVAEESVNFNHGNEKVNLQNNLTLMTKYYKVKISAMETSTSEYYSFKKLIENGRRNN